ncbi:serine hydrolase [Phormidium tenue FACHB-886]|nr:serine hydrolase [Phormidium tenue FACHB-886]
MALPKFFCLSGLISACLIATPAEAARLQSWNFDSTRNQLNIVTDESIQPIVQIIANPSRLVIDLPGTRFGQPRTEQQLGQQIRAVRVGQFNAHATRLVIELAPGYTLDPDQVTVRGESTNRWVVELEVQPTSGIQPTEPQAVNTIPVADRRFSEAITLNQPFNWLQQRIFTLESEYPDLDIGMFFLDLETGNYLDLGGDRTFPTASVIKLPILIAFFQDVDAGKIRLDERLTMRSDLVASGSGDLQDRPVGTQLTALETATRMITISDNTATNMILDRMGGIQVLNQRFRSWGLQDTVMNDMLPDLSGTNITTARDLVYLLGLVNQGKLVSSQSQTQAIDILGRTSTRSLLPAGLGAGATIAHKTGDIGFAIGDAGIIQMPNGRQYLGAVLLKRPYNDPRGRDFIRQTSQIIYTYLNQL